MGFYTSFAFILLLAVAATNGAVQDNAVNADPKIGETAVEPAFPPEPHSSTEKPITTTTAKSTTVTPPPTPITSSKTTPSSPKTTPSPTTSSPTTTSPTTPTPAPTTTSKPTPKPSPTPTPTPAPTPTPTPAPKPTPTPAPKPVNPEVGTWFVNKTGNSNSSCVILQAALQVLIIGKDQNNTLNIPKNATSSGTCGETQDTLKLEWTIPAQNLSSVVFTFNNSKTAFDVNMIEVNLNSPEKQESLIHTAHEFSTGLRNSYKCDKKQQLNLMDASSNMNKTDAYLIVSQLQVQAFQDTKGTFVTATNCIDSGTPDIVAIAVGCALVVLVLIILVAYLIGRRRSQARGYLSM